MAVSRRKLLLRKKFILNWLYLKNSAIKSTRYSKKRWWVHPIWQRRKLEGYYETLMKAMRKHDQSYFHNFTRMSTEDFDKLLSLVAPSIQKYTLGRRPIAPQERLAVTLRFLATGESVRSLAYGFRLGITTVHNIIKDTCQALWDVLQPIYLEKPTVSTWRIAAMEYEKLWNYPMCCGAVDGKHVAIQQPAKSGTKFYNYKGFNSIVLMAVVDAKYRFLTVDVGAYGSSSDGGIFKSSAFGKAVENGTVEFPKDCFLPGTETKVGHVLVGDEAFQLLPNFMRPYSAKQLNPKRRVFNYRLSRARRCSENAFGILASRWRVFRLPLQLKPENVDRVVKAACVLHNYLLKEEENRPVKTYCPNTFADHKDSLGNLIIGEWEERLSDDPSRALLKQRATAARNSCQLARDTRDAFCNYFYSPKGEVEWQWELLRIAQPITLQKQ